MRDEEVLPLSPNDNEPGDLVSKCISSKNPHIATSLQIVKDYEKEILASIVFVFIASAMSGYPTIAIFSAIALMAKLMIINSNLLSETQARQLENQQVQERFGCLTRRLDELEDVNQRYHELVEIEIKYEDLLIETEKIKEEHSKVLSSLEKKCENLMEEKKAAKDKYKLKKANLVEKFECEKRNLVEKHENEVEEYKAELEKASNIGSEMRALLDEKVEECEEVRSKLEKCRKSKKKEEKTSIESFQKIAEEKKKLVEEHMKMAEREKELKEKLRLMQDRQEILEARLSKREEELKAVEERKKEMQSEKIEIDSVADVKRNPARIFEEIEGKLLGVEGTEALLAEKVELQVEFQGILQRVAKFRENPTDYEQNDIQNSKQILMDRILLLESKVLAL